MYMKKIACAALAFGYLMSAFGQSSTPAVSAELAAVRPSPAHLAYQDREIIALVCWGLNPYTGQEWGFGNVPPSKITAKRLDPAQWAEAMKTAEIKSVVLVAKHHDGFCLWPATNNLEYSMAVVPAPNTGRDLVRELADACRANGMKFGVYLSPWDRHQGSYATPAYVDYFFAQWNDLMDNYGELCEMWLDGANGGTGWYGGVNGETGAGLYRVATTAIRSCWSLCTRSIRCPLRSAGAWADGLRCGAVTRAGLVPTPGGMPTEDWTAK